MSDEPITSDQVTPRGDDGTNVPGTGAVGEDQQVSQREDAVSDLSRDPGASAQPDQASDQTSVTSTEVKTETATAVPAPDEAPVASPPEGDEQS